MWRAQFARDVQGTVLYPLANKALGFSPSFEALHKTIVFSSIFFLPCSIKTGDTRNRLWGCLYKYDKNVLYFNMLSWVPTILFARLSLRRALVVREKEAAFLMHVQTAFFKKRGERRGLQCCNHHFLWVCVRVLVECLLLLVCAFKTYTAFKAHLKPSPATFETGENRAGSLSSHLAFL